MCSAWQSRPGPQVRPLTLCTGSMARNNTAGRMTFALRHHVHAVIHPVDEIDIGVTRRTEHDLGPLGQSRAECAARSCGPRYASTSTIRPTALPVDPGIYRAIPSRPQSCPGRKNERGNFRMAALCQKSRALERLWRDTRLNSRALSLRRIMVVGGGAAGFFAAITCAEAAPDAE